MSNDVETIIWDWNKKDKAIKEIIEFLKRNGFYTYKNSNITWNSLIVSKRKLTEEELKFELKKIKLKK